MRQRSLKDSPHFTIKFSVRLQPLATPVSQAMWLEIHSDQTHSNRAEMLRVQRSIGCSTANTQLLPLVSTLRLCPVERVGLRCNRRYILLPFREVHQLLRQ